MNDRARKKEKRKKEKNEKKMKERKRGWINRKIERKKKN